jgi:hypothetical protein
MVTDGRGPDGFGHRPWTEEEWERFMRQHEPHALARAQTPTGRVAVGSLPRPLTGRAAPLREDFGDEAGAQMQYIAAFCLAHELATVVRSLQADHEDHGGYSDESEFLWQELDDETQLIATSIATGHGIGYEDDHICGNIVKCRQGLSHAERSVALIQRLRRGREGEATLDRLLGTALFTRYALEERITKLRARVWWDLS